MGSTRPLPAAAARLVSWEKDEIRNSDSSNRLARRAAAQKQTADDQPCHRQLPAVLRAAETADV
jgi:hypothetical protein